MLTRCALAEQNKNYPKTFLDSGGRGGGIFGCLNAGPEGNVLNTFQAHCNPPLLYLYNIILDHHLFFPTPPPTKCAPSPLFKNFV